MRDSDFSSIDSYQRNESADGDRDNDESYSSIAFDKTPQQTYNDMMGITAKNPFGDNVPGYIKGLSSIFGPLDYTNIFGSQEALDQKANQQFGLAMNPKNQRGLIGYNPNVPTVTTGVREGLTRGFGSLFGSPVGISTIQGPVASQDRDIPLGEAAARLGIGALNPFLGYGLSNLGTTEMKLKMDPDYDPTKDRNDPRYISKGAFSGILDSVTGGGGSKVATTARDGLLSLADNVMNFFNKDGKAQAGTTVENIVTEQRGKEIADLEKERLTQGLNTDFKPITPTNITKEDVLNNSFMDAGNSLATNPEGIAATSVNQNKDGYDLSLEGIKKVAAERFERAKSLAPGGADDIELTRRENLPRPPQLVSELQRDIAKRRGLFSLPEASGLDNNVISAGSQNGKPLSNSILQALNEQGFNLNIDEESLIDAPRRRFFDGTDEISVRDSNNGLTFANSLNRPFNTSDRISEVPSGPALTASQLRASEFDGFTLDPITGQAIYDERGPVQRLKIKDLPAEYQELVALNTELDYGETISVQDLINMSPRGIAQSNTALIKELEAQLKQREKEFNQRLSYETDSDTQGLSPLY